MTAMILAGILGGVATVVLVRSVRPLRPRPSSAVGPVAGDRYGAFRQIPEGEDRPEEARLARVGRQGASSLGGWWDLHKAGLGATTARAVRRTVFTTGAGVSVGGATAAPHPRQRDLDQWLAVTDHSLEDICAESVVAGVAGAMAAPASSVVMMAGGVQLPFVVPVWGGLALGLAGCALPWLVLRSQAFERRRHVQRVTAAFLDLVVLGLAGGIGVEGALEAASHASDDWAMKRIKDALAWARGAGSTPWAALGRLGMSIGVVELEELAASVGLAGMEGAKVRQSLAAKAASMRQREQAAAESAANAVTERMFLPGVLLLLGFLLFIGYPAFVRVLTGI
ncbi:MAG: type II secretion system F family protein [Actinomycetota bacterium]|nr:type II secretion system F family protein [Actinomycetota bacterium]